MREETLERINRDTEGFPDRWREVLQEALLEGDFKTEAHRLLESAVKAHRNPPSRMETAESILAGDAFIPMAVEAMTDAGVPLEEMDRILAEMILRFKN